MTSRSRPGDAPGVSPRAILDNILSGRTAEGLPLSKRRPKAITKPRRYNLATAGIETITTIYRERGRQGYLTDAELTGIAWKVAAYVHGLHIDNDEDAFMDNMRVVGAYLAMNPDLINTKTPLAKVIEKARRLKTRRKHGKPSNILGAIELRTGSMPIKGLPVEWRSTRTKVHVLKVTAAALMGAPEPRCLRRRAITADIATQRVHVFIAFDGDQLLARIVVREGVITELVVHPPLDLCQDALEDVMRYLQTRYGPLSAHGKFATVVGDWLGRASADHAAMSK
jgi:hypothetical protein